MLPPLQFLVTSGHDGHLEAVEPEDGGGLLVRASVDLEPSAATRKFAFHFSGVKESTLMPVPFEFVEIGSDEDPLLWEHNERTGGLYFSSAVQNPYEVIGRLFERHSEVIGAWRPFEPHISANATILRGNSGLLAKGPESLMKAYQAAVQEVLDVYFAPWTEPEAKSQLLYFDDRYVIYQALCVSEVA